MPEKDPWADLGFVEAKKDSFADLGFVEKPATISPTLMESRQAASRSEFEANQPQSTMATRGRELALGMAEALGVDLKRPVVGTVQNLAGGVRDVGKGLLTNPLSTAGSVAGGIANAVTAGPREMVSAAMEGDYDRMAGGAGKTITGTLPAVYGGVKGVQGVRARVNAMRGRNPVVTKIEQRLAPSGREAQAKAMDVAPKLAQNPKLVGVGQEAFEKRLFTEFKTADSAVKAAETATPKATTIVKQDVLADIDAAIDKLQIPASPTIQRVPVMTPGKGVTGFQNKTVSQSVSGHPDALKVLKASRDDIAKLPDNIPFHELVTYRRQLDRAIQTGGGWKDTATAAERAAMEAKRNVVNSIRAKLGDASAPFKAANKQFSTYADGMEAAGLDWNTGRKLSRVGKVPPSSRTRRAAELAGKAAVTAAGAGAGYEIYQKLKN